MANKIPKTKSNKYREPDNYFPQSVRKVYGLGEYAVDSKSSKPTATAKKTVKRGK